MRSTGPGGTAVRRGRVVDDLDPEGLGRVRVVVPGDERESWAPVLRTSADAPVVPEVDDVVLVAYEDGEVERPIVLGVLRSSP